MAGKKIIVRRKAVEETHDFSSEIPSLLQRIYQLRGINKDHDISTDLSALLSFKQLQDIEKAAILLAEGVKLQKRFLVLGDFDTDGATSTALAVSALKAFGAKQVDYLIPDRFIYGYGLTPEIVEVAAERKPDILITVDNGIASIDGVLAAKSKGMQVVITDHHLPGEKLPESDAIVNPNQPGDSFPSKCMAGVGVIFYVMLALRQALGADTVHMGQFLDLVALGTVADMVPLDKNNRILVHQGLKRIQKGLARPGIEALIYISQRHASQINASDLGFFVAPRLNAAGRLEDMSIGVGCLLSETAEEAHCFAEQLDKLNKERRTIENDMSQQAEKLLDLIEINEERYSLCLSHSDFHQGVIGILAGRLKERYHRPTIVFSEVENNLLKGSARSISQIHLRDILAEVDALNPGLIKKFGGHAMAAGLTIAKKDFSFFSEVFNNTIKKYASEEIFKNILLTDGELVKEEFSVNSVNILESHLSWGQAFPAPLFDGCFKVLSQKLIKGKHLKLIVEPENIDLEIEAIAFNYSHPPLQNQQKIKVAYRLGNNSYANTEKIQLIIEYLEEV